MARTKDYEDYIEKCRRRLSGSKKWRVDNYDKTWRRLIQLYGNKQFDELTTMFQDMVSVNMTFSTVNVIYPSISVNYPKITVMPTHPEDEPSSEIVEQVVNYWWRHYKFHDQFRLALKDFVVVGHGWLKASYVYREVEADRDPQQVQQEQMQLLMQKQQAVMQNPDDEHLFPSDEEVVAQIPTTETKVAEDHPALERVSPFDILVDPDATNMSNIKWIAQRITMPLEEAKKNEAWDKQARAQLQGAVQRRSDDSDNYSARYEAMVDKEEFSVVVYEYYDMLAQEMCVVPEKGCGDKLLLSPQPFPFAFGQPFMMMRNYTVPENFYPLGDVECIESMQDELNIARSAMLSENKKHRSKYIGNKEALTTDAIASVKSSNDGEVILVERDNYDNLQTDVLVPLAQTPIQGDLYQMSQIIVDDINNISGVSEYARGTLPEGRRTATEASMIQDASNSRQADKLGIVERFISDAAQKVVQLAQQYLTTDSVVRIAGQDAAMLWMPYSWEDIQGEYDFEVEAGSTQPQNESFRRESAMQLLQTMAPFAQAGIINPFELVRYTLKNGFGIKNPEEFMMPNPLDPTGGDPNADPNAPGAEQNPAQEAQAAPPEQGGGGGQGLQQSPYGVA